MGEPSDDVTDPRQGAIEPETYSFTRYLTAKQTVDDRALHRPTVDALKRSLASKATAVDRPLRILEVGAGIGTMLDRLLEWGVLPPGAIEYVGVDTDERCVDRASTRARDRSEAATTNNHEPIEIETDNTSVSVRYVCEDALEYAAAAEEIDCVIAMAFLDLLDLPGGLDRLASALTPNGILYAPITFDGLTGFQPVADENVEDALLETYHETMDAPDRNGSSRTGRALFDVAANCGLAIVSAGGSDWVVYPNATSKSKTAYPNDEAYFLHHIVDTVDTAVREAIDGESDSDNHRRRGADSLSSDRVSAWATRRHHEIEKGELTYMAHQYDVLFERSDQS